VVASLFGWQRSDGLRRFRTAYCAVPRKNGKSTLSAGIALYLLVADGRAGRRDLFRCHHPRSGAHRIR
jgi:phage terminase large subunit-like protein